MEWVPGPKNVEKIGKMQVLASLGLVTLVAQRGKPKVKGDAGEQEVPDILQFACGEYHEKHLL